VGLYTYLYCFLGVCSDSDCRKIVHDGVSCLYFSIVTFTTTGYGDYHPTPSVRLIAASEALTGYIFFGLFVSLLASHFSKPRNEKSQEWAD
jgi:Ion channel